MKVKDLKKILSHCKVDDAEITFINKDIYSTSTIIENKVEIVETTVDGITRYKVIY